MLTGLSDTLSHNPLLALATLFGAGLVTSLTPCIYPMIPITAGILSGTSAGQPSRARTARLTLAYVTGLALFYADRKSTRLNSSHLVISYAVFCLKKKNTQH